MNVVSSDFFAKNLQFIEGLSSEASYSALQETGPSDLQYKDGSYIICKEDRDLALHSRQSPQDQAQRQIKRWIMQHSTALENLTVIFGCAGFYHVREFLKESYGSSYLLIVDNHPAHVRTLLENQDLSDLYSKGKICFIINANPRACVFEYSELIKTIPSINISFYVQPAIYRIYQENYDLLMDLFTKATKIEGMNRGTAASFSDEWLQNSLINLAYMLKSPGVNALKDKFSHKTAIMIAAGPSLNDCLDDLKKVRDQAVFIAVGQSLKPLLNAGIEPDFVVAIDSDPITYQQFLEADCPHTYLIAGDNIFTPIIDKFPGRTFFFSNALQELAFWLDDFNALRGRLEAGGTVAVTAIDLAVYMGCESVIFCGLDLAFQEDGTTHATGSQWQNQRIKKGTIRVDGNYSKDVPTTKQMAVYISIMNIFLEQLVKAKSTKFYNANTGGAKLESTELITPSQIIEKLKENTDKCNLDSLYITGEIPPADLCVEKMETTISELEVIEESAEELLKLSVKLAGKSSRKTLARMAKLDKIILKQEAAIQLLNCAVMSTCMHLISGNVDDSDDQQQLLYHQLKGGANWLIWLLSSTRDKYISINTEV